VYVAEDGTWAEADAFAHDPADPWYCQPPEDEPRELTYVDLRHVLARVLILPSRRVDLPPVQADCDTTSQVSRLQPLDNRNYLA